MPVLAIVLIIANKQNFKRMLKGGKPPLQKDEFIFPYLMYSVLNTENFRHIFNTEKYSLDNISLTCIEFLKI